MAQETRTRLEQLDNVVRQLVDWERVIVSAVEKQDVGYATAVQDLMTELKLLTKAI